MALPPPAPALTATPCSATATATCSTADAIRLDVDELERLLVEAERAAAKKAEIELATGQHNQSHS